MTHENNDIPNDRVCDHRVRELSQMMFRLRDDLRFTPHFEGGEKCYLIEDRARSQFFRVGIAEYLFISMLDGKTTVAEALSRLAQFDTQYALTEGEATAVCRWLVDSELGGTRESSTSRRLSERASKRAIAKRLGQWNPLCMKVPLAYPDRFFARITPWARHMFGPIAAMTLVVVSLLAISIICASWEQFIESSRGIFSPGRWIGMVICWLALKVIHESAHGVVCRKYGGTVHEAGAIFVLFAPLAYVDLTSSWRFRSKWKRIYTAAAGIYAELWIASLAAIAWSYTSPGFWNDLCLNVILMASLSTLVFNANPLMRFDGYYMLSDLLEIPNLYADGTRYLQYLGRRYLLGEKVTCPFGWSARDVFKRCYAVSAMAWRIVIYVSLIVAASMMFDGLGLVLAAAAIVLWVGVPMLRMLKYILRRDPLRRRRQYRLALVSFCTAGLLYVVAGLPWPGATRAAAIVDYEPLSFVRASSPGFIQKILVHSGQQVSAGQPIAVLENRLLRAELRDLELAIDASLLKSRIAKQQDEIHTYQAEMEQLQSLRQKHAQKQQRVDDLVLRAPASGRIVARQLPLMLGTYLDEGDTLAAVGDEARKELRLAIPQIDFEQFKSHLGRPLAARISGGVVLSSHLGQVDPRATLRAPEKSMYAPHGGQLESRTVLDDESSADQFELLTPHLTGSASLTPEQSRSLRVGQRGFVWLPRRSESIGSHLHQSVLTALPNNLKWVAGLSVARRRTELTTHHLLGRSRSCVRSSCA